MGVGSETGVGVGSGPWGIRPGAERLMTGLSRRTGGIVTVETQSGKWKEIPLPSKRAS